MTSASEDAYICNRSKSNPPQTLRITASTAKLVWRYIRKTHGIETWHCVHPAAVTGKICEFGDLQISGRFFVASGSQPGTTKI